MLSYNSMISTDEQLGLYGKILDMSQQTLDLLEADQIEEAMVLNAQKLEVIKYLAENKNSAPEIRAESQKFCVAYYEMNDLITNKVNQIKAMINESLRKSRITGKKVCAYQAISNVGR